MKTFILRAATVIIIVFTAITLIGVAVTKTEPDVMVEAESHAAAVAIVGPGELATLRGPALGGATKADLDRVLDLHGAGNRLAIAAMIASETAGALEEGTIVAVLELGFMVSRVQVQEGLYAGEAYWVTSELVRR